MIGSIIGAGLSAAGSIYGNMKSAQAMGEVMDNLNARKSQNQAWYDKNYYEDATQRADAQHLLQQTEEAIRNRKRQSQAAAAVTGATQESQAMDNAANAQAMADAMTQIALSGQQRKDSVERQYQAKQKALDDEMNKMRMQKAQAIAEGVKGVTSAAGNIASMF